MAKWKMPKWMEKYRPVLGAGGGWLTPEYAMNCNAQDCNAVVNAPRALICRTMSSNVKLLQILHAAGYLD